ncbi:sensor histidine kinase [Tabrizicola sp.]|uniref:sensor histidine kinase n=1 Tax=Tabrizicola sp. TaxID=2005166 RepID=UPI0035B41A3D
MVASNVDLSVIRELPASIMVLDRDLRFVTASEMYLQTTGRKLDDLVGRYLFDAFPESEARRKPLEDSMRRALAGEGNAIEKLFYSIPDPQDLSRMTEAWWRCRHNPLVGPDGSIGHVVQITENITAQVQAELQKDAIAHELQHRVGNLLGLVQAIARRTAGSTEDLQDFLHRFDDRMQSMARTHSYLIGTNWNRMSVDEVVSRQLLHGHGDLAAQMTIQGDEVVLKASEAQMLSMAIHELTTNSLKYGALRDSRGRLAVSWSPLGGEGLRFSWIESGVGPVAPSGRNGFGSMILDTILPSQLGGRASRTFGPDGLHYALTVERGAAPPP